MTSVDVSVSSYVLFLLIFFDAFGEGYVLFIVRVGGELDFFGDVFSGINELDEGTLFYDVEGVVERAIIGISCGEEEGVAVGAHFLVITAARAELVKLVVKFDTITLGRAVAYRIDGS